MIVNGRKICDNCFLPYENEPCGNCGYKKSDYRPDIGTLPVGTILKQRYSIGLVLGRGGFGVTYKAYDMRDDRVVAIKEYYPNGIAHRDTGMTGISITVSPDVFKAGADKFFEEAKTVSRFNGNPNIVGVYEVFSENNTVYYVMEYLEGMDLKAYIRKNGGKLSEGRVMSILNVITDALIITHSLSVIHRDISPDNIFILRNGGIKLIDFGAARQVLAEQSKSLSVILKQGFAPLEQYQRRGKQGPWTDIYALGATCYYALTGNLLDDATERIDEPSVGEAVQYGVSEQLWSILEKCLQVKATDRYQSVAEMKADLAKVAVAPEPLIEEKPPEDIPMTVMGSGEYATSGMEIIPGTTAVENTVAFPGTMAVSENNEFPKNSVENKSQKGIGSFLKSKKGIITIAASVVVLAVIITAAILISSGIRKNKNPVDGDVVEDDTTSQNVAPTVQTVTDEPFLFNFQDSDYEGTYTGEWNNGKPEGKGVYTLPKLENDDLIVHEFIMGTWRNGTLHGIIGWIEVAVSDESTQINLNNTDWTIYDKVYIEIGDFSNGQLQEEAANILYFMDNGEGEKYIVYPDGDSIDEVWDGKLDLESKIYSGDSGELYTEPEESETAAPQSGTVTDMPYSVQSFFSDDKWNGIYTGEWKNGKPEGKGVFAEEPYELGDYVEHYFLMGTWTDGKINGKGAFILVETPVNENTVVDLYTYDWSEYYHATIDVEEFTNGQQKDGEMMSYSHVEGEGIKSLFTVKNGGIVECIDVTSWDNKLDLNSELYN